MLEELQELLVNAAESSHLQREILSKCTNQHFKDEIITTLINHVMAKNNMTVLNHVSTPILFYGPIRKIFNGYFQGDTSSGQTTPRSCNRKSAIMSFKSEVL